MRKSHVSSSFPETLASRAESAGRLLILLFLFWIPLIFVPTVIQYQNVSSVFLKETFFLFLTPLIWTCAVGAVLLRRGLSWGLLFSGIFLPGILLGVWVLFLYWRAPHPMAAWEEANRWFCYLGLALSAAILFRDRAFQQKAWSLIILVSGVVALYGVIQFYDYDFFSWGNFPWALPLRRVCSSLGNPNFLGGYLVLTLPLTLVAIAVGKRMPRGKGLSRFCLVVQVLLLGLILWRGGSQYIHLTALQLGAADTISLRSFLVALQLLGFAAPGLLYYPLQKRNQESIYGLVFILYLQIAALGLTFSLGSLMGIVVGCFFAGVVLAINRLRANRQDRKAKVSLVILAFSAILLLLMSYPLARFVRGYREATVLERLEMYRGTSRMIADQPLTGFGPGMFSVFFPDYRPVQLALYLPPGENYIEHAHCEYLELAADFGLPGLGLFFWIVLAAMVSGGVFALLPGESSTVRWLRAGLFAAIIGTLAQNIVSVNLRQISTASLFWLLLGWLSALGSRDYSSGNLQKGWMRKVGMAVLAGLMALSLFNGISLGRAYIGDLILSRGIAAYNRGRSSEALYLYRLALELIPGRTRGYYYLGSLQFELGDYDGAVQSYRKVQELERHFVDVNFNLATTFVMQSRYDEALPIYEDAILKDPNNARLHDYYARALILAGRPADAVEYRRKAIALFEDKMQLFPQDLRLHHDLGKNYLFDQQWDKAEHYLYHAMEQEPGNPTYRRSWQEYVALRSQSERAAQSLTADPNVRKER